MECTGTAGLQETHIQVCFNKTELIEHILFTISTPFSKQLALPLRSNDVGARIFYVIQLSCVD
jgi:hypothetical protein